MFKIKSPGYKNRQETAYLIWTFLPTKFNFKIKFYNCHWSSYKEGFAILSIYSMENLRITIRHVTFKEMEELWQ